MPGDLLTTTEAAKALGIGRNTLARYAKDGVLRPALTLPSGHHRWDLDDVRRQLAELHERQRDEADE